VVAEIRSCMNTAPASRSLPICALSTPAMLSFSATSPSVVACPG
jgi:hypothetical protein